MEILFRRFLLSKLFKEPCPTFLLGWAQTLGHEDLTQSSGPMGQGSEPTQVKKEGQGPIITRFLVIINH